MMTPKMWRVLEALNNETTKKGEKAVSAATLIERMKVNPGFVGATLYRLSKEGHVVRSGPRGRGGAFEITTSGRRCLIALRA